MRPSHHVGTSALSLAEHPRDDKGICSFQLVKMSENFVCFKYLEMFPEPEDLGGLPRSKDFLHLVLS